jgi:hypothetical protein
MANDNPHVNQSENIISEIERQMLAIPRDTAAIDLPERLKPLLTLIYNLDAPTQNAMLHHEIKDYFSLTNADIRAYEKQIKTLKPADEQDYSEDSETIGVVDNLIHWVQNPNDKVKFLLDIDGQMEIKETIMVDGKLRNAKQDMGSMLLPQENILNMKHDFNDSETSKKLLADIALFVYDYIELPKNKYYLIIALYIMHTYLLEKLESSPFLYMFGTPETGKSRAGKVVQSLAFRCKRETTPTGAVFYSGQHTS